jgi:fatty acid desaturase
MKHSRLDLILVAVAVIQVVSLLLWAKKFDELSIAMQVMIFSGQLFLFYFNPIVITHNFLHTGFFKSSLLNFTFSTLNSMNLGLPQILYKYHHLNHHRYNNSPEDPSSTYTYGKKGLQEHWFSYSCLGLFRDGTQKAWVMTLQKKEGHLLGLEILSVLFFWGLLSWLSWKFFLTSYLPLFYFGWFLAHLENYFEHYKARSPSDRFGNAVSIYHPLYNLIMFNEGYHQEHHISPQEHWRQRPLTQKKFQKQMKSAGAYEARMPPLLGMFE